MLIAKKTKTVAGFASGGGLRKSPQTPRKTAKAVKLKSWRETSSKHSQPAAAQQHHASIMPLYIPIGIVSAQRNAYSCKPSNTLLLSFYKSPRARKTTATSLSLSRAQHHTGKRTTTTTRNNGTPSASRNVFRFLGGRQVVPQPVAPFQAASLSRSYPTQNILPPA
jgi:hypothetical protein